jgi:hypothetical protein
MCEKPSFLRSVPSSARNNRCRTVCDDALEVNTPPTDDPIDFSVGAYFDDPGELRLGCRQARHRPTRPIVEKPIRAGRVEPMNPVAKGLAVHAAHHGRFGAAHAVDNAASDSNRRLWLASSAFLTRRRSSPPVKSARNLTADGMARILLAPMNY